MSLALLKGIMERERAEMERERISGIPGDRMNKEIAWNHVVLGGSRSLGNLASKNSEVSYNAI